MTSSLQTILCIGTPNSGSEQLVEKLSRFVLLLQLFTLCQENSDNFGDNSNAVKIQTNFPSSVAKTNQAHKSLLLLLPDVDVVLSQISRLLSSSSPTTTRRRNILIAENSDTNENHEEISSDEIVISMDQDQFLLSTGASTAGERESILSLMNNQASHKHSNMSLLKTFSFGQDAEHEQQSSYFTVVGNNDHTNNNNTEGNGQLPSHDFFGNYLTETVDESKHFVSFGAGPSKAIFKKSREITIPLLRAKFRELSETSNYDKTQDESHALISGSSFLTLPSTLVKQFFDEVANVHSHESVSIGNLLKKPENSCHPSTSCLFFVDAPTWVNLASKYFTESESIKECLERAFEDFFLCPSCFNSNDKKQQQKLCSNNKNNVFILTKFNLLQAHLSSRLSFNASATKCDEKINDNASSTEATEGGNRNNSDDNNDDDDDSDDDSCHHHRENFGSYNSRIRGLPPLAPPSSSPPTPSNTLDKNNSLRLTSELLSQQKGESSEQQKPTLLPKNKKKRSNNNAATKILKSQKNYDYFTAIAEYFVHHVDVVERIVTNQTTTNASTGFTTNFYSAFHIVSSSSCRTQTEENFQNNSDSQSDEIGLRNLADHVLKIIVDDNLKNGNSNNNVLKRDDENNKRSENSGGLPTGQYQLSRFAKMKKFFQSS